MRYDLYVDPGHSESDTGAVWPPRRPTIIEAELNHAVAFEILERANARGITACLGPRIYLPERGRSSKEVQAKLVISIHHNAGVPRLSQTETYLLTSMDEPEERNLMAARIFSEAFLTAARTNGRAVKGFLASDAAGSDDDWFQRPLHVLRPHIGRPVVLLECAYLTNAVDREQIMAPDWPGRVASWVDVGLEKWWNHEKELFK